MIFLRFQILIVSEKKTMRNFEKLKLFNECYSSNQPPPDHVGLWLKKAITEWENGKTLAEAFNILDSAAERQIRRNALLAEYRRLHPDLTCWQIAQAIAEQVKKNRLSPILKQANSIYPLPSTPRQLYSLLKLNSV